MPKEVIDFNQAFTIFNNDVYSYNFFKIESYFNDHFTKKYKVCTYRDLEAVCNLHYEHAIKSTFSNYIQQIVLSKNHEERFDGAKLHWLINDVKINGLSYPPQGLLIKNSTGEILYSPHPGTFRFFALYIQNLLNDKYKDSKVVCLDLHNYTNFSDVSFYEWLSACTTGFIRKQRDVSIHLDEKNRLEVHETNNHHDDIIQIHDDDLAEMFNNTYPNFFINPNTEELYRENMIDDLDYFNLKWFNTSIFHIPNLSRFEGVSVYVSKDVKMIESIYCIISLLNITDAVCYTEDLKIIVFNNSHPDTKKLTYHVVNENNEDYYKNMLWTSCKTMIPSTLKGVWYEF